MGINIPPELKHTLNSGLFLKRDSTIKEDRILIFTTAVNMKRLSEAPFWIMDGTFKTVPIIFYQMYTIHAPVGHGNRRVFPLMYAFMTGKSEVLYKRLFQDLTDIADENEIDLNPQSIISDLELAVINAAKSEFPNANTKLCFFSFRTVHLEKNSVKWIVNSLRQ